MARTIITTVKDDKIYCGLTYDEYDAISLKISFVDAILEVFKSDNIEEFNPKALPALAYEAAYKLEEISKILDRGEENKKDN